MLILETDEWLHDYEHVIHDESAAIEAARRLSAQSIDTTKYVESGNSSAIPMMVMTSSEEAKEVVSIRLFDQLLATTKKTKLVELRRRSNFRVAGSCEDQEGGFHVQRSVRCVGTTRSWNITRI